MEKYGFVQICMLSTVTDTKEVILLGTDEAIEINT